MPKAVIIGAGIGGIAAAIRLAVKGYDVEIFEAAPTAGGKLSQIQGEGFRFDAGPSLFTMPQYVDELFLLAGKTPSEYFQYRKLDRICKYFYDDGTQLTAYADKNKFATEVEHNTSDSAETVISFLNYSQRIYEITDPVFLQQSLHRFSSYVNFRTLKSALAFFQIDPFRTMDEANHARFTDNKTIQLFNRYATYNGSNPYKAPATLNVIPHFEQHFGTYFPEGGMFRIVESLQKLAADLGVKFTFNSYVDQILVTEGKASGVMVEGQQIISDAVISNMDIWYTYKQLLRDQPAPERILSQERSSSALIFYWGISAVFPELDIHNIFFTQNYEREFRQIWEEEEIPADPTIYVHVSSKIETSDAPTGCENWFVMINVPSNSGQDWDHLIASVRTRILAKLSGILKRDIETMISYERILDPRDIDEKTFSYRGSLYGSSSNSRFAAFFRHPNFSRKIHNLYFTGGSVHPGGGIPLALLSAKIASDSIRSGEV